MNRVPPTPVLSSCTCSSPLSDRYVKLFPLKLFRRKELPGSPRADPFPRERIISFLGVMTNGPANDPSPRLPDTPVGLLPPPPSPVRLFSLGP